MNLSSILSILILLTARFSFAQQNIWEPIGNRLGGYTFTSFAIDKNDILYSGTLNGLYKSMDNGDSWILINNGIQGHDVYSIVFNNYEEIFIGTSNGGGIYKSTDAGNTWIHLNDPLVNFSIMQLVINSEGHLFAAIYDHGIYRSTNNGDSWEQVNNGLNQLNFQQLFVPIKEPVKDYIYLSVGEIYTYSYVYRSTNNGDSWELMNFFSDTQWIVAFISTSTGDIYLGTQEQWHNSLGGIYKSTDLGMNWINLRSTNVSFLLTDYNDFVYAVAGGVIRSNNSGIDWESFSEGLPIGNGGIVTINSTGQIFLTMDFEGIYKTIESTTSVNENPEVLPNEFNLFQNYPNPFNPSTTIHYQIPQGENVTLKVYDLLGEEIRTLVNEEKAAGNYEVNFDASVLKSGVYFYSLQTESFRDTKKMILIK